MTGAGASTPFPLGVYIGNPDNSSPGNEARFEANAAAFTALMGASPAFFDSFVDQTQPMAQWVGNSQWAASSAAASSVARGMVPVVALPFSSSASGSLPSDQSFAAIAAGQEDGVLRGIVQAWASAGFTSLVVRPGWEMNLQGPTFAGTDPQSQADWVAAFRHSFTVLHQAAADAGIALQVVWNPGVINYSNALATTQLYPGDAYVDAVGADMYSDLYPYMDGGPNPGYHDWDTGGTDAAVAQFIADPVNRAHYWTDPAATKWALDGSEGHSLSFMQLAEFARDHGKPFAVPETGAGNSNAGTDVTDDAAFPAWLSGALATAKAAGTTIDFVNLWDSNGGGNYAFSGADGSKPAEAAAWAAGFGASGPAPATTDTLTIQLSEDAWLGDAQYTIAVNGQQIGGVRTETASHGAGQSDTVSVAGNWGAAPAEIAVSFLNDAWGGTASTDRNLYVDGMAYNGAPVTGAPAELLTTGTRSFMTGGTPTKLALFLSEDAWLGDAQFAVAVDGQTLVANGVATASQAAGAVQEVDLSALLAPGSHDVAVSFLNDAWGGTPSPDRNLYVQGLAINGTKVSGVSAALYCTGTVDFGITVPTA